MREYFESKLCEEMQTTKVSKFQQPSKAEELATFLNDSRCATTCANHLHELDIVVNHNPITMDEVKSASQKLKNTKVVQ